MQDISVPNGNASPALITASGMEDGSLFITSCLGTQTFPATAVNRILYQQSEFLYPVTEPWWSFHQHLCTVQISE